MAARSRSRLSACYALEKRNWLDDSAQLRSVQGHDYQDLAGFNNVGLRPSCRATQLGRMHAPACQEGC
ncbi:hypothetical protein PG984_014663 [Apiospora sp. TS-2023a]